MSLETSAIGEVSFKDENVKEQSFAKITRLKTNIVRAVRSTKKHISINFNDQLKRVV